MNIFYDTTWIHVIAPFREFSQKAGWIRQDHPLFHQAYTVSWCYPRCLLKSQASPHTLLLHPRGMAQSSVLHPGVVYRVKDKTKSRNHLNADINIKQEYFLLFLLCIAAFTMRKIWMDWYDIAILRYSNSKLSAKPCSVGLWHCPHCFRHIEWKKTTSEKMALPQICKSLPHWTQRNLS